MAKSQTLSEKLLTFDRRTVSSPELKTKKHNILGRIADVHTSYSLCAVSQGQGRIKAAKGGGTP